MATMMKIARNIFRPASLLIRNIQVTVLGAANEIGQTVSLLLRAQPAVTKLVLHDYLPETQGIILDVSHVPSESAIVGYSGDETLDRALKDSQLIVATGGVLSSPGHTKRASFAANAMFIKKTAAKIAKLPVMPFFGIVTEPINSMIPMAAEVLRNHGYYDGKKLFGITGVDLLRAQCLYALENRLNPRQCFVPVIGGHSDHTTIPLLSQAKPQVKLSSKDAQEFTSKIRKGEDLVTRAKKGTSPTLSVAFSVLVFVRGILNALEGHPAKVHAYVENNDFGTSFFSGIVSVNREGVGEMQRYTNLSDLELHLLDQSISELRRDISKGRKTLEVAPPDLLES